MEKATFEQHFGGTITVGRGGASHTVIPDGGVVVSSSPPPNQVSLDDLAEKIDDLRIIDKMIAEWTERKKAIQEEIRERLGDDGVGTVRGTPVFGNVVTAKFSASRFAAENPQIAAQFTTQRVTEELNLKLLESQLPDLYQQYRVRQLTRLGSRA